MLDSVFDRFVEKSPVSVMARGILERILNPEQLDEWFLRTAEKQYTKELLFSVVFELMNDVVCGVHSSVHSAYQASEKAHAVSIQAVYQKLNGIEITTSAELVRYAAREVAPMIAELGGTQPPRLPGYRIKILDGNCLEASEHRLKELRSLAAGVLPGKSLVVYDPQLRIPCEVFPCEDGHAQERSLLREGLTTVTAGEVWIADRNFCTRTFLGEIDAQDAYFIIRQHANLPWTRVGAEHAAGRIDTGTVSEQPILVYDEQDNAHHFRRIRVCLQHETRDGDREITIITNVPQDVASAEQIAALYRGRWTIETAFQELTAHLHAEIKTLGYPPAALFGFCLALVAYMSMKVIRAALGAVHGVEKVENEVSDYYVADELAGTSRGMMIAIPEVEWTIFRHLTRAEFVHELQRLASQVHLEKFRKHPRGPKKPAPKKKFDPKTPHVSTAKLIQGRKKE
jgi:IS4 transposase